MGILQQIFIPIFKQNKKGTQYTSYLRYFKIKTAIFFVELRKNNGARDRT